MYVTHPLPLPDPPDRIFSHDGESLDDVQVHPAAVVIATLLAPPAIETNEEERPRVYVHDPAWADAGETAASVTVKILPAIVTVPLREELALLAATLICTVPLPDPEPPDVTVIHDTLLVAVRLHPLVAVTAMLADPPEDVKLVEVGDRL